MGAHDRDPPPPAERPPTAPTPTDPDPGALRRTIRARGETVGRRELRCVLDRLRDRGTLTDRRRVVARMATAIVEGPLVAPDAALADAVEHDRETVRPALELSIRIGMSPRSPGLPATRPGCDPPGTSSTLRRAHRS